VEERATRKSTTVYVIAELSSQTALYRFVVVSILNDRKQTPVAKRTLNPVYNPKDATFDFPIYLSLADKIGVVEIVAWDKDLLKRDYLGEVSLPLEDWFVDKKNDKERVYGFHQEGNEVRQPLSMSLF